VQGATLSTDEGLSNLVTSLLPDYVVSDHPRFVAFIEAYFEFLEQEGNSRFAAATIDKNIDVDQTLESFIKFFKDQYLTEFPTILESGIDDKFLVKNIKDYYQEKGNPRSLDLLFRILFNLPADVEFPRDKILSLSDADVDNRPQIIFSNYTGVSTFAESESYQIKQTINEDPTTGVRATAFLDDVKVINFEGTNFVHADLLKVQGNFAIDVPVQVFGSTGDSSFEKVIPVFKRLKINDGGSGYSRNDTIVIKTDRNKIVETLKVKKVSSTGAILTVDSINQPIIDVGNYNISVESTGVSADFTLTQPVATIVRPRVFKTQRGLVSSDSTLQDNNKFQQFSYVIKAEKSLRDYSELLKKLFHPSGVKFFSQFQFQREFTLNTITADSISGITGGVAVRPVIGHYLPYTMAATFDLRGDTAGSTFADYYPSGFNGLTAATFGNYGLTAGRAVTHDPFNKGTFVTGPLGGNTGGTFNPEFYSTGVTKLGYAPLTTTQLKMNFTDENESEFFNIYRHPKNMRITGTVFPSDEDQYSSQTILDDEVELFFDPVYEEGTGVHAIIGYPQKGDVALQRFRGFNIGDDVNKDVLPRVQAFGTVLNAPELIPDTDSRYYERGDAVVGAGGFGFKVRVKVHDGEFINTGYERFSAGLEDGYVQFTGINILGTRTLRGKRYISQTPVADDNIRVLGVTGASFAFHDVKVRDFLESMRFTSVGLSGGTGDRGSTIPPPTPTDL